MRHTHAYRRTRISAADLAIIATIEPMGTASRTAMESLADELAPVLDPFPWELNRPAERNFWQNRRLHRRVYSLDDADIAPIAAAAAAAGWIETAPNHWECPDLAVLILRDHGAPNAALIVDIYEAMRRWNAQHPKSPWPDFSLIPLELRPANSPV